jgi:urate oxidase
MAHLGSNRYGKQHVRVLRKHVEEDRHSLTEVSVDVLLEGTFDKSYLSDDNTEIVATDTVKNTIIALAHTHLGHCIEDFGQVLGRHFLSAHNHVDRVHIEIREKVWDRMNVAGKPAPHSFVASGNGEPFTRMAVSRIGADIQSGVGGLHVMNSTNSAFCGFDHTEFTTLQDATDRIFSAVIHATWRTSSENADFLNVRHNVTDAILKVFVENFSPSEQRMLFEMGEAALVAAPEVSEVELRLPNKHYFVANLDAFGISNQNITYLPQDEPNGEIEAIVRR